MHLILHHAKHKENEGYLTLRSLLSLGNGPIVIVPPPSFRWGMNPFRSFRQDSPASLDSAFHSGKDGVHKEENHDDRY